jgi:hypothetical protein
MGPAIAQPYIQSPVSQTAIGEHSTYSSNNKDAGHTLRDSHDLAVVRTNMSPILLNCPLTDRLATMCRTARGATGATISTVSTREARPD